MTKNSFQLEKCKYLHKFINFLLVQYKEPIHKKTMAICQAPFEKQLKIVFLTKSEKKFMKNRDS